MNHERINTSNILLNSPNHDNRLGADVHSSQVQSRGGTEKVVLACASFSLGTGFGMGVVGVLMCKSLM